MIPFRKLILTAAVCGTLAGAQGVLAASSISYNVGNRHVSYNGPDGGSTGPAGWSGSGPTYTGPLPYSWYAGFDASGGSATLTSADANAVGAQELMAGARAFRDIGTNWGHNSDLGMLRLSHPANVTITVSSDNSLIGHTFTDNFSGVGAWVGGANTATLAPGLAVWQGWAATGSRHGPWTGNGDMQPYSNNPNLTGLTVITGKSTTTTDCAADGGGNPAACAFNATQGTSSSISSATLVLNNLAAGDYTIFVGGYLGTPGPSQANLHVAYQINLTATPVPIPAALWLFGSALAGLGAVGRRRV